MVDEEARFEFEACDDKASLTGAIEGQLAAEAGIEAFLTLNLFAPVAPPPLPPKSSFLPAFGET